MHQNSHSASLSSLPPMFRHRKSDQKPNEELIQKFKNAFPDVVTAVPSTDLPSHPNAVESAVESAIHNHDASNGDLKMNDPTPRTLQDFQFTQSLMDMNSFSYMSTTNQPLGYCTPTTDGINTIYHQAGDVDTPALGFNLSTPLPASNILSDTLPAVPAVDMNMSEFQGQFLPQQFQNLNPFAQQPSYGSRQFIHRNSIYDPMDDPVGPPMDDPVGPPMDAMNMPINSLDVVSSNGSFTEHLDIGDIIDTEKFRYHVILRAPTAMIKHADEIPVTYLNKGQAYSISVVDTTPPPLNTPNLRYRTSIRVSFEDEEQRSKPAACWQLWKEGRGSSEAHQRDGKLLAVEYVDPIQGGEEEHSHPQIELESASFDGFCVTWTSNPKTRSPDCAISVRFNFLSTDFSHSKGVKGIPVRLCAKTEVVSPNDGVIVSTAAEVCYCKAKLFRDHGAERKLSNDVAHVKKAIEKLKLQIAQLEMGDGNSGKRKRSVSSVAVKVDDTRPSKVAKQRRTWSMDSSSDSADRLPEEEDLYLKLAMMQDMFSSTRAVSVLSLKGEDHDDPDLFPVSLPGDSDIKFESSPHQSTRECFRGMDATSGASSILSPSASSVTSSGRSSPNRHGPKQEAIDWTGSGKRLHQPVKIQRVSREGGTISTGYIEAIDIDPTYRPPAERPAKPIACFYIRFPSKQPCDDYYRAVYLSERTVRDFMTKISEKHKIDPERITRILRVKSNGLEIMVDDDMVKQLPDGQDMVVEFAEAGNSECSTPDANTPSSAVEVKLTY